ncbi:PepSY-associated TM helix domain-containing protein [Pedobacter aquatilis]|uniref:PepSY-associated TM helix domain-containing protein n=1 Tax=Pedobacter aquatilis TaxID=351343 RepID=UPI00292EA128|nr:PepSY-associated TM helix domain-containing protein [Pedobacter aquatilis]
MAKSRLKKAAGWLHLWIGLVTGLVVVIVSITGCIYVFDEEIFNKVHSDLVYVQKTGPARPVSELLANAQKAAGIGKELSNVKISSDDKSYVFSGFKVNDRKKINLWYFSQFEYLDEVYVNQYTGKVLGVMDMRYEFFNVVEQLHRQLLLVKPIGSPFVGACILCYLVMLITGFILWLPKNYKQFKKSITVKWNAKWKRVNYDLHNSFGFYVLPFAILIAITGLVWSFKWWETGIYRILGDKGKAGFTRSLPKIDAQDTTLNKIDIIHYGLLKKLGNDWTEIGLGIPNEKTKVSMSFVQIESNKDAWRGVSYYFYDGRTGDFIDVLPHDKKTLGMKWRNSNLELHTGRLYGLGTQIIAFLAALISASLPISGFLIWWGKRNKKKRPSAIGGNSRI